MNMSEEVVEDKDNVAVLEFAAMQEVVVTSRPEWMSVKIAAKYFKYASSICGWPLYVITHSLLKSCILCHNCRCCACLRTSVRPIVEQDNCCHCNFAAVKQTTGLPDEDILYISFRNEIYEVPFLVAVDHELSSIVVAIRGSMSLVDILTDLTVNCARVEIPDMPFTFAAHKGILQAARYVQEELDRNQILKLATATYPNYELVLTGHSLGAGTAALLGVLIRPFYPNLRCYCFSPPKIVMDQPSAKYSEDFIMSVVVGDDLVARLSFNSVEDLKQRLMRILHLTKLPKYRILAQQFCCLFPRKSDHLTSIGCTMESDVQQIGSQDTHEEIGPIYPEMFLPGHILHVQANGESVTARWEKSSYFQKILVSIGMLRNHMPHVVYPVLLKLIDSMQ